MTKEELLKQCAEWVKDDDWWDLPDYLFELGFSCQQIASYIEDADDKGYEHANIYVVETLPGRGVPISLYIGIYYCGGRWDYSPQLCEVEPYITTRYKYIKNWTDEDS
jgi:hypothetical protein